MRRHRALRTLVAAAAASLGSLALASCARASTGPPGTVEVVAAENFWGNIAAQIGGNDVHVTSLISDPNADPHLVQTDARDAATLAQAEVVIENGAGYDTWMGSLLAAGGVHAHVVDAARVLHVTGTDPNPHLWYDIPRVPVVAAAVERALSTVAPEHARAFRTRLAAFDASLTPLEATLTRIKSRFDHVPVAYTERLPGYLLARAGLDVKTPPGFARAVEDGVDPSVADTQAMRELLANHDVNVLLYNMQTVTAVTAQMRTVARAHGIRVVAISETMPPSAHNYQQWQATQLRALVRALETSRNP